MSVFHFLSVSWEIIDGIWPNFVYALILKTSRLGIVTHEFSQVNNTIMALDWGLNFVFTQYLENKLMEFDKILQMHIVGLINFFLHSVSWQILIGILLSAYFGAMLYAGGIK